MRIIGSDEQPGSALLDHLADAAGGGGGGGQPARHRFEQRNPQPFTPRRKSKNVERPEQLARIRDRAQQSCALFQVHPADLGGERVPPRSFTRNEASKAGARRACRAHLARRFKLGDRCEERSMALARLKGADRPNRDLSRRYAERGPRRSALRGRRRTESCAIDAARNHGDLFSRDPRRSQ